MAGIHFDINGQALTEEQRQQIAERQASKQRLMEAARADRQATSRQQNSHVGVELSYALARTPEAHTHVYQTLAGLSNELYEQGLEVAGQVIGALALGMQRAQHNLEAQVYQPGQKKQTISQEERLEAMARVAEAEQTDDLGMLHRMPRPQTTPDGQPIITGTLTAPEALESAPEGQDTPEAPEAPHSQPQASTDASGSWLEAEASRLGITVEQLAERLSMPELVAERVAQGAPAYAESVGQDIDASPSTEASQSPEPQETPQAKAARERRAAKAVSKQQK